MSLPPYLLERLKRRKIIKEEEAVEPATSSLQEKLDQVGGEEIIAEDHSDEEYQDDTNDETTRKEEIEETSDTHKDAANTQLDQEATFESVVGCPNKWNIYHECRQYCVDNYSKLETVKPTIEQRKQLALILQTFPISNEWTVVFDPGVKTFYFWNILTNLVSWVPPSMNGYISLPADEIRKSMKELDQV